MNFLFLLVSCNCSFWWNKIMCLRSSFQSVKLACALEVNDWPLHCTGWPMPTTHVWSIVKRQISSRLTRTQEIHYTVDHLARPGVVNLRLKLLVMSDNGGKLDLVHWSCLNLVVIILQMTQWMAWSPLLVRRERWEGGRWEEQEAIERAIRLYWSLESKLYLCCNYS